MKDHSTGIVILSRYSSGRLPGKALKPILGKPVLAHIIDRLCRVSTLDNIILASSIEQSDDAIAQFAEDYGVRCYRGSLENVAQRFHEAAALLPGTYATRINGDNIFVDQAVLKRLMQEAEKGEYDFLSNVQGRTYPRGMSVEIVNKSYYARHLPAINDNAHYREHVMVYLYDRAQRDRHFYLYNEDIPADGALSLALDTPEDFNRSRWMMEKMGERYVDYQAPEIIKLYQEYEQSL